MYEVLYVFLLFQMASHILVNRVRVDTCVCLREIHRRNLSLLFKADEFLETIVHLLDGLVFSETHATLVGDVVDAALGFGVFTAGTADLSSVKTDIGLLNWPREW